jgi:hypothetical protein
MLDLDPARYLPPSDQVPAPVDSFWLSEIASEMLDHSTRGGVHLLPLSRPARLSRCRADHVDWILAHARSISSAVGL